MSTSGGGGSKETGETSYQIRLSGVSPAPAPALPNSKTPNTNTKTQSRHVITIAPFMTVRELLRLSLELFGVSSSPSSGKRREQQTSWYRPELWTGFPPKKLSFPCDDLNDGEDESNGPLVKDFIRSGENVMVKFETVGGRGTNNGPKTAKTTTTTTARKGKSSKGSKKRPRPSTTTNTTNDNDQPSTEPPSKHQNQNNTRLKRASAIAATESFAETIRAQNKLLRAEAAPKKPSPPKPPARSTDGTLAAKRASAAQARAAAANARRLASLPGGRRLDGETHQNTNTTNRPRRGTTTTKTRSVFSTSLRSESDISTKLLSSLSSPSTSGNVGKFLRSAMRSAVGKTYEVSRAVVRNSAVASGEVVFVPHPHQLGGGEDRGVVGLFTIRYPKGIEGRGYYEEELDVIGMEALRAVVGAVHADYWEGDGEEGDGSGGGSREMLRPHNMALLSPRVFWSLWFHFHYLPSTTTSSPTTMTTPCTSIEQALINLHPTLDWKFLRARSRELSAKAKDNLRQNRHHKQSTADDDDDARKKRNDFEQSRRAVEEVEMAMEKMYEDDIKSARDRAGRAALSRFAAGGNGGGGGGGGAVGGSDGGSAVVDGGVSGAFAWSIVTPEDIDHDELRECILEGLESLEDGRFDFTESERTSNINHWVETLISQVSVHNWRELANADSNHLHSILTEQHTQPEPNNNNTPSKSNKQQPAPPPSIEAIDAWIDAAQTRSIDEIMLEILDGNDDLFGLLRDEGPRAGTPKDLCLWSAIPSMLLEEVRAALERRGGACGANGGNGGGGGGGGAELVVTEGDTLRWCRRARVALDELDWLEIYITPIA